VPLGLTVQNLADYLGWGGARVELFDAPDGVADPHLPASVSALPSRHAE
jgi:hypothetical protein